MEPEERAGGGFGPSVARYKSRARVERWQTGRVRARIPIDCVPGE
ncbi:hypothetical protein [Tychonema sp. LEGE 07196]|nr:hypothetical protein [Tychonema sp. LEGE 07196]